MKIKPMLGDFALDGLEYIESLERRALVEHPVPGLEGNYLQDLGSEPNRILLAGTRAGDDERENFLTGIRELFKTGKPTTFTADITTATDLTDVVIEDLQVAEVAGSADSFRYVIVARKYTPPPEPPETGLLDTGILDDALGALGAMDVLDALVDIPTVADPTEALKGSLDGVKSVTAGLADVAAPLNQIFGV
ncbi:MAG: hypothetical protein ACT4P6_13320 [Gemmatimonadaceae bacterium]